jgi:hypothetical protein
MTWGHPDVSPALAIAYRFGAVIWLLAVAMGLGYLMNYANRPGDQGSPVKTWPGVNGVQHSAAKPTLLLFAHPQCPCTRASIQELSVILAQCRDRVDCRVLFYQSEAQQLEWVNSPCWRQAESIPGIQLVRDWDARLAGEFGVRTSGHALLYAPSGQLLFEGGITPSRGHQGENGGSQKLLALIESAFSNDTAVMLQSVRTETHHVFGCPLQAPRALASELPHSG